MVFSDIVHERTSNFNYHIRVYQSMVCNFSPWFFAQFLGLDLPPSIVSL